MTASFPAVIEQWFTARGWRPRPHQRAVAEAVLGGESVLLIAPTGGGKTLAGFLPSLVDLHARPRRASGLHTLYISPLKALAADVARNLETPVAEMELPVSIETRTGDTSVAKRQRQKRSAPNILLTTPEQLALLIASREAPLLFRTLRTVVLDELHALAASKRGDLLALGLARLERLAPGYRRIGLSATVAEPLSLARYLSPQKPDEEVVARIVMGAAGARPEITVLASEAYIPWAGHSARHQIPEVMNAIRASRMAIIFVNTRMQAEFVFQELWRVNEDTLPIALHHGSLDATQRRKVEAAMAAGQLRAVVATSTLDLGIDWGDVDLVIQIGAPKGASRLQQRIGRANHRLDEPSRALLVPANRFEALECACARDAAEEGALDGEPRNDGALDVLAQHIWGAACAGPFDADELYAEVISAAPYAALARPTFDRVLGFVATGGYALKAYERFARLRQTEEGLWRLSHPRHAQAYRMNVGAIVEAPMLKVRPGRRLSTGAFRAAGATLGEVEEWFAEQLTPGDTFLFAGQVLRFEGLAEGDVYVSRTNDPEPKIPSWNGGKFPLSTFLADRVRRMVADPGAWHRVPEPVAEWLRLQQWKSALPKPGELLVETFPRGSRHYLVCYPFEGRLAHQTMGMLVTRRLERLRMRPLGFVASEYALAVWSLRPMGGLDMARLFDEDMLGDDLDAWLAESALLKRTFRTCAVVAGLIPRRFPGKEKTGKEVSFSADLIYDVLRQHEPGHVLLEAAYQEAAGGLLDIRRLGMVLRRVRGRIVHRDLARISPLAVPVMLEIGREPVYGEASDVLLSEAADTLAAEAMA